MREDEQLMNLSVTSEQVLKKIDKLKINNAPGVNNVYSHILKQCKGIVSGDLTYVFDKSVVLGEVTSSWRQANIIPIFKKDDKSLMSNFQPISLTSVVMLCNFGEAVVQWSSALVCEPKV